MKLLVATNRVIELTAAQVFELFDRQLNTPSGIRSITVVGRTQDHQIGTVQICDPYMVEVRWSEEAQERKI